jgi:hypothetical protein
MGFDFGWEKSVESDVGDICTRPDHPQSPASMRATPAGKKTNYGSLARVCLKLGFEFGWEKSVA